MRNLYVVCQVSLSLTKTNLFLFPLQKQHPVECKVRLENCSYHVTIYGRIIICTFLKKLLAFTSEVISYFCSGNLTYSLMPTSNITDNFLTSGLVFMFHASSISISNMKQALLLHAAWICHIIHFHCDTCDASSGGT